ncbi:MAG TPA: transcriptional repressor [Thermoclostridium sp.]
MNKRNSAQKIMIENSLMKLNHPTAAEIYEDIRKDYPNISLGTVYRNLGAMAESGEILRIPMGDSPDRFDINSYEHMHVVCTKCGHVFDAESNAIDELFDKIDQIIEESTGVQVESREMIFKGTCSNCREKF